jgi:YD repeat-containing protein
LYVVLFPPATLADSRSRSFGVGATDNFEIFLVGDTSPWTYQYLILPDDAGVFYPRISSGTSNTDAIFQTNSAPGQFYRSTVAWNGNGWNLTLKDGTVYTFPDSYQTTNPAKAAVIAIADRRGNSVTIKRDDRGNIIQITSPNGRWLNVTHDSNNRITQLQDDLGRTVTYTYDTCASGMLCRVTDADGLVTSYTYDSSDRMLTTTDPRDTVVFTNQYDAAGRVALQTLADASTYQFSHVTDPNGNVTQTKITDPNGNVEQKAFAPFTDPGNGSSGTSNTNGFMVSDITAQGKPEQQTTTWQRDPSTNEVTSVTDALGRVTDYTYDYMGNLNSITRLAGTAQAVTTSYTYT